MYVYQVTTYITYSYMLNVICYITCTVGYVEMLVEIESLTSANAPIYTQRLAELVRPISLAYAIKSTVLLTDLDCCCTTICT